MPKMENLEDAVNKLVREVHSKGTPAEIHIAAKLSPDIVAYLHQTRNSFTGEINLPFLQKVFQLAKVAFYSDQEKLQMSGLGVMQRLLEEDRFSPKQFTGESRQAFPEMFVNTLAELCLEGSDDIVVEILRVSLKLASQPLWMQDPYALMKIIMFCMQVCGLRQSQNVKTAASATNVQAITSFCIAVLERVTISPDSVLPCDFQTVLTFFGDNLENLRNFSADPKGIEVLRTTLLSIYTVMQNTPTAVQHHPQFQEYVWQRVTPALCHWLGTPAEMYMHSVTKNVQAAAGMLTIADMEIVEIKLIAQIFLHLAKVYSRTDSMRCVLGSLLQRMLSVASVRQRLYTLNNLQDLLESPSFVAELEGPNSSGNMPDTCIIELISETMAKLAKIKHPEVESICTKLALAFLTSLEHVAEGGDLKADQVASLNRSFVKLKDTSPMSLDQLEEQVEKMKVRPPIESEVSTEKADTGDLPATSRPKLDSANSECDEGELDAADLLEEPSPMEKDDNKIRFETQTSVDSTYAPRTQDDESASAHRFIAELIRITPELMSKISSVNADGALQVFASNFCEDEKTMFNGIAFLNADAIYVAAYQTIRFVLRARERRYYTRKASRTDLLPMSQKEFVAGVLGCGLLVHMAAHWIIEVYRTLVERDLLMEAGFPLGCSDTAFTQVVRDIEGIGRDHPYLHDCVRLENVAQRSLAPEKEAGSRLARYLVGRCWNGIEHSLQCVYLDMFSRKKMLSGRKEYTEEVLHLMCSALGGLQRYADLCARLHLYELCNAAYALLARVCCTSLYPQPSLQSPKPIALRLHPWNVLSIDVILRRALDMGSRNPDCWKAFFTCYLYLHRLEMRYLLNARSSTLTKRELQDCSTTVTEITTRYMGFAESKPTDPLDTDHSYLALGALLNALDGCFLDAVNKLNLTNLCNFIRTMGDASIRIGSEQVMLMERLANIVILSAKCGRPLLHVMIVWASAIPFLYQAAASKTPVVSEKAVSYIHSVIAALTCCLTEIPNFHFNELQLKPFESLICSQVCTVELQELVVYSLCNLVETTKADIKSGWKSLFSTLRGIQLDGKSGNLVQAVGDVYEAYLNSESIFVFCASLWECLQSLMKLYRTALDISVAGSLPPSGHLALKYIRHAVRLLFSLQQMTDFPGLVEANRFRTMLALKEPVDQVLSNAATVETLDEHLLEQIYTWIPGEEIRSQLRGQVFVSVAPLLSKDIHARILEIDNNRGVALAVHNVMESLTGGLLSSRSALNNEAIETIVFVLRAGIENHCVEFCIHVSVSLLLPTIQQLLRHKNGRHDGPFQQLIGLYSDFVADLCAKHHSALLANGTNVDDLLSGTFVVLAECINCGHETTVRLATSCIRHLTNRLCSAPTHLFRSALSSNLLKLLHVTFVPLYDLMCCYNQHSKSIYGDTGHIKIAIANDSSFNEMQRVRQGAFQVFLTESQRTDGPAMDIDPESRQPGNSFTFLIYPSELDYHTSSNNFIKRITLEQLAQSLMAHSQIMEIVRQFLAVHNDKKTYSYLPVHLRLALLCAVRQVHRLTSDFNHLSGLKFLIKRMLASTRAVSLYHLAETSGVAHSIELLRCLLSTNTLDSLHYLLDDRPGGIENVRPEVESWSTTFLVDYFKIWVDSLLMDYLEFVKPNFIGIILNRHRSLLADNGTPVDDSKSTLVEVQLNGAGITSVNMLDHFRQSLSKDAITELLADGNVHSNGLERKSNTEDQLRSARKNPFREAVTSPTELPQDVARELKAAMDEDRELCHAALVRPLCVILDAEGLAAQTKVAVLPFAFYLCRVIMDQDLEKTDALRLKSRQFLLNLQKTLYANDTKERKEHLVIPTKADSR